MQRDCEHVRYLRRARLRWAGWRILESAGVGAAAAGSVGFAPAAILLWRGDSALTPALILLAIGAASGAAWGALRRPTLAQTSLRADQQLGLHDLLSTALLATRWRDEQFLDVVFAQANAFCRQHSPNEILVRRLSTRAWGAIGIVASLLLTVSMMSGGSVGIAAATAERTNAESQHIKVDQTATPRPADAVRTRLSLGDRAASRGPLKPQNKSDEGESSHGDSNRESDDSGTGRGEDQRIAVDAAGESEGRTDHVRVAPLERPGMRTTGGEMTEGGLGAAGGGAPGNDAAAHEGEASHTAPGAATPLEAAPWAATEKGSDSSTDLSQIRTRRVPDAYSDVVREYFSAEK